MKKDEAKFYDFNQKNYELESESLALRLFHDSQNVSEVAYHPKGTKSDKPLPLIEIKIDDQLITLQPQEGILVN